LWNLDPADPHIRDAALRGCEWLLNLQNTDGGWPTFCRGWMNLPFDRSGADLTAHAVRALFRWYMMNVPFDGEDREWAGLKIGAGVDYLGRTQRPDGSWVPLWFGNQHAPDEENPVYGTARVLAAYEHIPADDAADRGRRFLRSAQNADGGWGGTKDCPSSVEETALAIDALIHVPDPHGVGIEPAVERGLNHLIARVEDGSFREPAPIGFYFAKLWYFEKLYPIIFTVAALGRACHKILQRNEL
jgi:squalene-hopene/tetraprenyl-beta-curcumene cyclase